MSAPSVEALRSVAGRVTVITGAGQGIGRVLAAGFAEAGAKVVVADLNADRAAAVAAEITDAGQVAVAVTVDVSSVDSVAEMARAAEAAFGPVEVLVNNAALFSTLKMQPFEEIPLDVWSKVMAVNVDGPFLCARACLPGMRAGGFGRIVNVSSAAVTMGRPNYLHYTTSKAAVIGMTRSMARELGPDGITVNAVLPGSTQTEVPRETVTPTSRAAIEAMQCIPRGQRPQDLLGVMLFLASEGAGFITGQSVTVDGGATHL